jgi:hypothetical protein
MIPFFMLVEGAKKGRFRLKSTKSDRFCRFGTLEMAVAGRVCSGEMCIPEVRRDDISERVPDCKWVFFADFLGYFPCVRAGVMRGDRQLGFS